MQNSKKKQIFCNQFELFKDKKFKQIPSLKLVKVEQPNHKEQIFNESSAEDIFEQMGNKEINQDQQKQTNKEPKINKNDDWKSYYNSRLKEIKLERPELNHNQLTQLISEEWKMIKKQFKKAPQSSNHEEDVLSKKRIKQNKDNSKFCQEIIFEKQESDGELDFNPFECAKFIENLRQKKFKLVINDMTYELPGNAIIEAVDNDSILIYLTENNNILNKSFYSIFLLLYLQKKKTQLSVIIIQIQHMEPQMKKLMLIQKKQEVIVNRVFAKEMMILFCKIISDHFYDQNKLSIIFIIIFPISKLLCLPLNFSFSKLFYDINQDIKVFNNTLMIII